MKAPRASSEESAFPRAEWSIASKGFLGAFVPSHAFATRLHNGLLQCFDSASGGPLESHQACLESTFRQRPDLPASGRRPFRGIRGVPGPRPGVRASRHLRRVGSGQASANSWIRACDYLQLLLARCPSPRSGTAKIAAAGWLGLGKSGQKLSAVHRHHRYSRFGLLSTRIRSASPF
jgi:hypothetical protein